MVQSSQARDARGRGRTAIDFLSGYWPASTSLAVNNVNVGDTLGESLKHANVIEAALIIFAIISTGWFAA
jgi:hypothetical protein